LKTTLKNCPDSCWKTAFEKELREALKEHHGCKRSQCAEKNRIMEILGSKEFLGDSE